MTQELSDTLVRFITTPGFPFRLGIMLAAGIVAGYLLYRETKDLWRWGILIILFIVFEEWIRGTLIDNTAVPITLAIVTLGIFGVAVGTGAMISAKCREEHSFEEKLQKANDVAIAASNHT